MLNKRVLCLYSVIVLAVLIGMVCSDKREDPEVSSGTVVSIAGNVQIYKVHGSQWEELTALTKIDFGDSIKTGAESQVAIKFTDKYAIKIQENSKIVIPTIHSPE